MADEGPLRELESEYMFTAVKLYFTSASYVVRASEEDLLTSQQHRLCLCLLHDDSTGHLAVLRSSGYI